MVRGALHHPTNLREVHPSHLSAASLSASLEKGVFHVRIFPRFDGQLLVRFGWGFENSTVFWGFQMVWEAPRLNLAVQTSGGQAWWLVGLIQWAWYSWPRLDIFLQVKSEHRPSKSSKSCQKHNWDPWTIRGRHWIPATEATYVSLDQGLNTTLVFQNLRVLEG